MAGRDRRCARRSSIGGDRRKSWPRSDEAHLGADDCRGIESRTESLIDPRASIDATAKMGGGTQGLPGAVVSADAVVGQGCILNHKASVDHECQVGWECTRARCHALRPGVGGGWRDDSNGCHRAPENQNRAGGHGRRGAVVVKDVPDYAVVVGNPARVIRIESP